MSKRKSKSAAFVIVVVVLLVLLLIGGIAFPLRSCNSTNSNISTFSLLYGKDKLSTDTNFILIRGVNYRIEVVDSFGKFFSDDLFTVKIFARIPDNENICWRVANISRSLKDLPELTDYLLTEKGDDYFVLNMSLDFPEILQDIYGDLSITQAPSFDDIDNAIFDLVVTSVTGIFSIVVPLCVYSGVVLDITKIVF